MAAANSAATCLFMSSVPQTRSCLSPIDRRRRRSSSCHLTPCHFSAARFHLILPHPILNHKKWPPGGSFYCTKKHNNPPWKRPSSLLADASFSQPSNCCSLNRHARNSRITPSKPTAFLDKSTFHLPAPSVKHVPCASVGPNEPHAASTACPDGIVERQDSDLLYPEILRRIAEFLSTELPSHPKLYRGKLKNGLRYLILPNKVPPNRFEGLKNLVLRWVN